MKYEKSCGAVIFTRAEGEIKYLLIEQKNGVFGFPKGHVEPNETERQTAEREIFEEVGLTPTFIEGFCHIEEYPLPAKENTIKQVVYFLAEYDGAEPKLQEEEVSCAQLLCYDEAMSRFQFESKRTLLKAADDFIRNMD